MKFLSILLAFVAHTTFDVQAKDTISIRRLDSSNVEIENGFFWERFVEEAGSLSLETKPPSRSPPLPCSMDVSIDCITPDGRECRSIGSERPPSTCFDGNDLNSVQFQFQIRSCMESSNQQGDLFACETFKPFDGKPVLIECTDTDRNRMAVEPNAEIHENDVFTVTNPSGRLPGNLVCTFVDQSGAMVQQIQMDTSGATALQLEDTFGAATLVSCNNYSCLETLHYTYKIVNDGPIYMDVYKVERSYNGVPESILGLLNASRIEVGESVSIEETRDVNLCEPLSSSTDITVEALAPSGDTCRGYIEYVISSAVAPTGGPSGEATTAPVNLESRETNNPTTLPAPGSSIPPTPDSATLGPTIVKIPSPSMSPTQGPTTLETSNPTQRPSLVPSRATTSPTAGPTTSPTARPTTSPTARPTTSPTARPTAKPTQTTPRPTPGNTVAPSAETMAPTSIVGCNVTADIKCINGDGQDCRSSEPKSPNTCSGQIGIIRFLFTNCTCLCSNNMQGNDAVCQYTRPFGDTSVIVGCTDINLNAMNVTPSVVTQGSIFTVRNSAGGSIADKLLCTFTQDGEIVQNITINTAGNGALRVLDKFGTSQVVSCDEETCLESLCFSYTIKNVGTSSMNITRADREYNSVSETFLSALDDIQIVSGQEVAVGECRELNVCESIDSNTTVYVEADSPSGIMCSDDLTYSFAVSSPPIQNPETPAPVPAIVPIPPTEEPTRSNPIIETSSPTFSSNAATFAPTSIVVGNLTIDIQCATSDSKDCSSIGSKSPNTCMDEVKTLEFLFTNCTCQCSNNEQSDAATCEDKRRFGSAPVSISCTDDALTALYVTPSTVVEGEIFTVNTASGGDFSNKLVCTFSQDGKVVQTINIDSPSESRLELLNQYGAAQVVSCDDKTCLEKLCYNYTIVNVGNISMDLTRADRVYEGVENSFLDYLTTKKLGVGQSVSVGECRDLNVCGSISSSTEIIVEADSPGGISSNHNNSYNITIVPTPAPATQPTSASSDTPAPFEIPAPVSSPPSSSPAELCDLDLVVNCKPPLDAESCESIPPLATQCIGSPIMMEFLFTGGDCGNSLNVQPSTVFNCTDYDSGPQVQDGDAAYVHVTDDTGDIIYHASEVLVGSKFKLYHQGSQFALNQIAQIYSDSSKQKLLQEVRYHSSCSGDLFLKDRLGALQLVAWKNNEQGDVTSYHGITFDFEMTVPSTIAGSSLTVDSLQTVTNFGVFNNSDVQGWLVSPGETFSVSLNVTLDLTVRKRYTLFARLEGTTERGSVCLGSDFISFVAGNPLPPIFPSMAPTPAPSITAEPTPDPDVIACNLKSAVVCERAVPSAINFPGPLLCSDIKPATQEKCIASYESEAPVQVRFLVGHGPYYFNVTDRNNDYVYVNGTYNAGEIMVVDGNPPGVGAAIFPGVNVKAYADNNGSPGEEAYSIYIDLLCDSDEGSVSLGNVFEDLTLIAFETRSQGVQAWYDSFAYVFSVENVGELPATLTSGIATTIEFGTRELVSTPVNIKAGHKYEVGRFETGVIDLRSAKGQNFSAHFANSGTGTKSGIACNNTDSIGFTI